MAHPVSRCRSVPALGLVLGVSLLLSACGDQPAPPRKMQTVKLLPDQLPPPPPPPKPEEKKPEPPKPDDKPAPAAPKPDAEPAQALKSDEAAGDGPGNGLVAGAVMQEYSGEKLGDKPVIAGSGGDATARLAATSFANATTRTLNEFLARERELKRVGYRAQVHLWLSASGTLERAELVGSTGDTDTDRALREALMRFPGAGTPPQALPQPLRLQVTNRMLG
jgi:periplasmic protein TonB